MQLPHAFRRLPLYLAIAASILLAVIILKQCSTEPPFSASVPGHSGGDTIDVAIEYAPVSYYRTGDSISGFAFEVFSAIASDSMPVKFHPISSLSDAISLLQKGVYDAVAAAAPMTSDYDSTITFTPTVYLDRQILVQRVDSAGNKPVNSVLDLAGKEVAVASNSPMLHRMKNIEEETGDSIFIASDSSFGSEQLFLSVAVGDIPYAVINEQVAKSMATDYPDVDITTAISFTQFQSWMLRSDNTAANRRINTAIESFKQSGHYSKLLDKYNLQ